MTAQDNLRVVQAFFDRYPHLRSNDFYLASESYGGTCVGACAKPFGGGSIRSFGGQGTAIHVSMPHASPKPGHYVPQLAQEIVLHNMGPYGASARLGSSSGSGVRGKGKKGKKERHKGNKHKHEDADTYDVHLRIKLKGILVGNPYTDPVENLVGMVDSLWGRDLIPAETYEQWSRVCMKGGQGDGDPDAYYGKVRRCCCAWLDGCWGAWERGRD